MANRLWYEFKCSICHRTVTAPVMNFNGPGKHLSARHEDCGAEYIVDNTRERACPTCYRTGQSLKANGIGKVLINHEHRGDPLGYVIDTANLMELDSLVISHIRGKLYDVLVGPVFEGGMGTSPWVEFEGRSHDAGLENGFAIYDGWKLCFCLGECEENLDLRYYWHPYHFGLYDNTEDMILDDESAHWIFTDVYCKNLELAKAVRKTINEKLGNSPEQLQEVA